jgi:hypothetical protein
MAEPGSVKLEQAVATVPILSGGSAAAAAAPARVAEAAPVAPQPWSGPIKEIQQLAYSKSKFLGSILEQARRWEAESGELRLFFAAEKRALAEMLQGREHVETLRQIASQVLGEPQRICVRLEAREQGRGSPLPGELAARVEQNPIVHRMLQSFGGRILDVTKNRAPTED